VEIFTLFIIITGIYEIITGNYIFITNKQLLYALSYAEYNSPFGLRIPVSIFDNPNNCASFIVFSFFISLALSRIKTNNFGKYFSLIICLILFFLLIATQSRSSLIGLFLGLFSMSLVYFRNSSINKKTWIICICIFCLLLASGWLISNKEIFFNFIGFHPERSGGSDNIRVNLIKKGLIILKNKFFLGTGLGNIEYNMAQTGLADTFGIVNIHNWWLEILVSSGIIIFLLYVYIYARTLMLLYRGTKNNNVTLSRLSYCFFGFSLAFIVTSMGPSSCMGIEWMWPAVALFMTYSNYNKVTF
jgi:teichuronic acid biosynthesis protein TuaE